MSKKSQREEDLLVSALSNTFNSTNGFSSGVEKKMAITRRELVVDGVVFYE